MVTILESKDQDETAWGARMIAMMLPLFRYYEKVGRLAILYLTYPRRIIERPCYGSVSRKFLLFERPDRIEVGGPEPPDVGAVRRANIEPAREANEGSLRRNKHP